MPALCLTFLFPDAFGGGVDAAASGTAAKQGHGVGGVGGARPGPLPRGARWRERGAPATPYTHPAAYRVHRASVSL